MNRLRLKVAGLVVLILAVIVGVYPPRRSNMEVQK